MERNDMMSYSYTEDDVGAWAVQPGTTTYCNFLKIFNKK